MLRRPLSEIELKQDDVDELKATLLRVGFNFFCSLLYRILKKECKVENMEGVEERRQKGKPVKNEPMPEEDMIPPREGSFTTP